MPGDVVICEVRYRLRAEERALFEEYGRAWVRLIEKHGGTHYGFFLPRTAPHNTTLSFPEKGRPGCQDEAIALYGFPNEQAYQRYRTQVPLDPEAAAVITRFADPPFESYERIFLRPLSGRL